MTTKDITCMTCKKVHRISAAPEEFAAFNSGVFVQKAFPDMSEDDRELLISQMCGPCFDKLFEE